MNEKLNFHDLVGLLSEKAGITKKDAENFLRDFFDLTTNALLEDKQVKIKNLGTFKIVDVSDRESVDVRTGERVVIPSHSKIGFAPDSTLSKIINEPFAMFEPVEVEGEITEEISNIENPEDIAVTPVETVIPDNVPIIEEKPTEKIVPTVETVPTEETAITEKAISSVETVSENITEPEQIQTPEEPTTRKRRKKKKKSKKTFFIILSVAVILSAIVFCILKKEFVVEKFNYYAAKITQEQEKEDILKQIDDIKTEDDITAENTTESISGDLIVDQKDTIAATQTTNQVEQPQTSKQPETTVKNETPKTGQNAIEKSTVEKSTIEKSTIEKSTVENGVKTRKIAEGERLTIIALQEYGSKDFWVYLYEENKATIKNPGNIKVGSKIIIPPASKYNIDKNNPESIKKAKELQNLYK